MRGESWERSSGLRRTLLFAATFCAGAVSVGDSRANAQALAIGSEFQINTYTTGYQIQPSVAGDGAGGFLVVWDENQSLDGSGQSVRAQRFDSEGLPIGTEFQVNSQTTGNQYQSAVASTGEGTFVVVWTTQAEYYATSPGIAGQRFDSNGAKVGTEFQVNTYTTANQDSPKVAATVDGSFIVVWSSPQDGSGSGIYAQRYESGGERVGTEFQVNTYTTYSQNRPTIAAGPDHSFIVLWAHNGGSVAQRFDTAGERVGTEFSLAGAPNAAVGISPVNGDYVFAWEEGDGNGSGVYARRYDSNLIPLSTEFRVTVITASNQYAPKVQPGSDGSFTIVWEGDSYLDTGGVFARRFSDSVDRLGNQFAVNTYTPGLQFNAAVAAISDAGFVVAWESRASHDGSYSGIFGQRFEFSPLPTRTPTATATVTDTPSVTATGTSSETPSHSPTVTPSNSPTMTPSPSRTPTPSNLPTFTSPPSPTPTPSNSPTVTLFPTQPTGAEQLVLPLTQAYGITSEREYAGLVEITISGTGGTYPTETIDPFYTFVVSDEPVTPFANAITRLSRSGCVCDSGNCGGRPECDAPAIASFIVFIDGVGQVPSGTNPPYRDDHTYDFIVDLGQPAAPVTIGLGDAGGFDNYGTFTIVLRSIDALPLPTPTATSGETPTVTPTAEATLASSPTATETATESPLATLPPSTTPTVTSTPTRTINPTFAPCVGNCDMGPQVTVDELIRGVNIALGRLDPSDCSAFDSDRSGTVSINELIVAVNNALYGCGVEPPTRTPTSTVTRTRTATRVPTFTPSATRPPPPSNTRTLTRTPTATATPAPTASLADLLGTWTFSSSIGGQIFDYHYRFESVSTDEEGDPYAEGTDLDDGGVIVARRIEDITGEPSPYGEFGMLDPGIIICNLFIFDYVPPNGIVGFNFLTDVTNGDCGTLLTGNANVTVGFRTRASLQMMQRSQSSETVKGTRERNADLQSSRVEPPNDSSLRRLNEALLKSLAGRKGAWKRRARAGATRPGQQLSCKAVKRH